jgi:hypothetical protein
VSTARSEPIQVDHRASPDLQRMKLCYAGDVVGTEAFLVAAINVKLLESGQSPDSRVLVIAPGFGRRGSSGLAWRLTSSSAG